MKKNLIATVLIITTIGLLVGCGATENKDIGKNQAQEIAFSDANVNKDDVSELHISREEEGGKTVYEINFTDTVSGAEYDYEIFASDGTIQKVDQKNNNTTSLDVQQNPENRQADSPTQDNSSNQSSNKSETQTKNNGKREHQTQRNPQNQNGGNSNTQAQVSLSLEDAKKMVLERVPGATENDVRIKLDYDDGYYVYEGEVLYGQKEYEFEIDANTGTFLEWSEEIR